MEEVVEEVVGVGVELVVETLELVELELVIGLTELVVEMLELDELLVLDVLDEDVDGGTELELELEDEDPPLQGWVDSKSVAT